MSGAGGKRLNPTSSVQLQRVVSRVRLRPRRSLGQTFLTDANVVRKILSTAGVQPDDPVLEIRPGAGAMTESLVEGARRVLAIEIDPTLVAILKETASSRLHIVQKDVLQVDWPAPLQTEAAGRWKVVANLPYAITGPAILKLLEAKEWLAHLTIMVQLEVAERLVAPRDPNAGPPERARWKPRVTHAWLFASRAPASGPSRRWTPRW